MKMSPSKKGPKTRLTWLPSSSISRGFAGGTKEFPLAEENNVLLELTKYFQNYFRVKCWSLPKIHSTPKTPSEYLMKSLKRFRKHSSNGMLHLVFTALKKILLTCRCLGPLPGVCGWSTLRGSYWIWEETRLTINFLWPTERPAPIIVIFSAWYPGVSDNNVLEINSWQTDPESEDNPQYNCNLLLTWCSWPRCPRFSSWRWRGRRWRSRSSASQLRRRTAERRNWNKKKKIKHWNFLV